MRSLLLAVGASLAALAVPAAQSAAQDPPRIADNSFLVEEAYNQERGVVQHISNLEVSGPGRRALHYTFTQEWSLGSQRHQLSYSLPLHLRDDHGHGLGDVQLHYRLQVGVGPRVVAAPRVTLALPSGAWERGLGYGSAGVQVAVPVSARMSRQLVAHLNGSVAVTPWARSPAGGRRTLTTWTGAGSVVGPVMLPVNGLLELVATDVAEIGPAGDVVRTTDVVASPGVRVALDAGGVQVVPGLALPVRLTGKGGPDLLVYLSVEHAFRHPPARGGVSGEEP